MNDNPRQFNGLSGIFVMSVSVFLSNKSKYK